MQADRWLKAASHPWIVFKLAQSNKAEVVKERMKYTLFDAVLEGDMKIVEGMKPLSVESRIKLKPDDGRKRKRPRGDIMEIDCEFTVTLSDYGIGIGDPGIGARRIAEGMNVNVSLKLSTIAPAGS